MSIGFYFDEAKCMGCRSCQVACKDRNNLPVGQLFRHMISYETGTYPDVKVFHQAKTCNHCASAACVANCPTGAMQYADDGAVVHDDEVCIGCGTCVNSCPYEVPLLDEAESIARKCDSCKALRDAGMNPVCVDACPMRCLDFGEIGDLKAKYGDFDAKRPYLPSPDMTSPSTMIKPRTGIGADSEIAFVIL
ncbi:4Fe-4S dicluster domain-containing protein [Adlercreutzia sp. R25]|uniref:4Fe-4S dicluster domain-containing protein n=1 Tax=Adlercreutzia shanghongiae TaxID=3111773 RepID=UPI002DBE6110|nr:4Fe-4S dicluster domain-containing protein [Adlercreutzia sp. R25]MEC4273251.1 4Fe-4S dicluster domain-containing protein [Adlercreutzia sp. R25]